jgi:NTP pyrophosphatase (non-canonical NTP hydrolase)
MNLNEYQKLANRTAPLQLVSEDERSVVNLGHLPKCRIDLEHGALGVCTEGGELLDVLKRHKFYAKPIDWVNVVEEAGDILWYVAIIARAASVSLEDIAEANIAKLKLRYTGKYTNEAALNRDTKAERKALEEHV